MLLHETILMTKERLTMLRVRTPLERLEWKSKREARRKKQREQNKGRALKMRKLRLAEEKLARSGVTVAPAHGLKRKVYVGCSGWFYWHWRGLFYPAGAPPNEWFQYYRRRFNTVELNAPFYSWPTVATVNSWIKQAGKKEFVYTVKVNELITHVKHFRGTKQLVRDFGYIAGLLGPRLGCFLFQLPPSFHYTLARLRLIFGQLDCSHRNVVEFRHPSWWNATVYRAFRKHQIIFCSCSAPRLPDTLVRTADEVYVRFHGLKRWYRHNYTVAELEDWAAKIAQSGATRVWAYFNNDREGFAIKNAKQFLKLMEKGGP